MRTWTIAVALALVAALVVPALPAFGQSPSTGTTTTPGGTFGGVTGGTSTGVAGGSTTGVVGGGGGLSSFAGDAESVPFTGGGELALLVGSAAAVAGMAVHLMVKRR